MKRECRTCKSWKPVPGADISFESFGNCQKISNGSDVRISGHKNLKLQTAADFGCKYFGSKVETKPEQI